MGANVYRAGQEIASFPGRRLGPGYEARQETTIPSECAHRIEDIEVSSLRTLKLLVMSCMRKPKVWPPVDIAFEVL